MGEKLKEEAKKMAKGLFNKLFGGIIGKIKFYAILIMAGIVLLVGGILLIDLGLNAKAAETMQGDLSAYISIQGDQYIISDDFYTKFIDDLLKEESIDASATFFGNNNKYLKAIIEAEIMSSYPKLGDAGLQGIVQIVRRTYEAGDDERYGSGNKEILLKYMPKDQFDAKVQSLQSSFNQNTYNDLRQYFTFDLATLNITIPKYSNGTFSTENIAYKTKVDKYSVPAEFLITQLQITSNPEYIYSLADMAKNNSKIEIVIQETYSYLYSQEIVYQYELGPVQDGEELKLLEIRNTTSESESTGLMTYIREVDTWIVNSTQKFVKNDTRWQELTEGQKNVEGTYSYTKKGEINYIAAPATSN